MWISSYRTQAPAVPGPLYFNDFSTDEDPLSDGGKWTNPAAATWTNAVKTAGGRCYGPSSSGSNDAIRMLSFLSGVNNYRVTAIVAGGPSGAAEIEILVRCSSSAPDDFKCYEIDLVPSLSLVGIAKWMGPQGVIAGGNYVATASLTTTPVVAGQQWDVIPNGAGILVYQDGALLIDYTDVNDGGVGPYLTGPPGIGFDAGNPADGAAFGWASYRVDR